MRSGFRRGGGGNGRGRGGNNRLRIIAGRWRGRKVSFPDVEGLRPSPDRIRETLFNWLMPIIEGSRCLDLFAGSGALGLEALSRGASSVVMVDRSAEVIASLREQLAILQGQGAEVVQADALGYLDRAPEPFDVVFLDPPYRKELLGPCCERLAAGWVVPGTQVYIEAEADLDPLPLPANWELVRSRVSGQVGYHLAVVR